MLGCEKTSRKSSGCGRGGQPNKKAFYWVEFSALAGKEKKDKRRKGANRVKEHKVNQQHLRTSIGSLGTTLTPRRTKKKKRAGLGVRHQKELSRGGF